MRPQVEYPLPNCPQASKPIMEVMEAPPTIQRTTSNIQAEAIIRFRIMVLLLVCKVHISKVNSCSQKNSRLKSIVSISRNHVSLQFRVVKFLSYPNHVISAFSCEIKIKLTSFSFKITLIGYYCDSRISRYTQMAISEIMSMLNSRNF